MSQSKATPELSPLEYRLMATLAWPRTGAGVEEVYFKRYGTRIGFGSLYGTLKRLRHDSLVKAGVSKEDRRFKIFRMTGSGKKAFLAAHQFYAASHFLATQAVAELETPGREVAPELA